AASSPRRRGAQPCRHRASRRPSRRSVVARAEKFPPCPPPPAAARGTGECPPGTNRRTPHGGCRPPSSSRTPPPFGPRRFHCCRGRATEPAGMAAPAPPPAAQARCAAPRASPPGQKLRSRLSMRRRPRPAPGAALPPARRPRPCPSSRRRRLGVPLSRRGSRVGEQRDFVAEHLEKSAADLELRLGPAVFWLVAHRARPQQTQRGRMLGKR